MSERARRKTLLYITDLERRPSGGGSYVVNWHAADELQKRFDVTYAGPLVPNPPQLEKTVSKIRRRILGTTGKFFYFSPATLDDNAAMAESHYTDDMDAVVFRSATRWCRCSPGVPYFVYLDAVFHTFFHNTFQPASFDAADIERIYREEAAFLEEATGVFFESRWGLERAREAYQLQGQHYRAVGRGGAIDPPDSDTWSGSSQKLVTMAMNFRQKGGDIVLDAFRKLKPRFPSLTWHVVGAPPEGDWRSLEGIIPEGILRPDVPADLTRLQALLADAFLLVHPTREDTAPLVLTEAAYFGCPSVSVNCFAIPEVVIDGRTGLLVESPPGPEGVAAAIEKLLTNRSGYLEMRRDARAHALSNYVWSVAGDQMAAGIEEGLAK